MRYRPPSRRQARWITGAMAAFMGVATCLALIAGSAAEVLLSAGAYLVMISAWRTPERLTVRPASAAHAPPIDRTDAALLILGALLVATGLALRFLPGL